MARIAIMVAAAAAGIAIGFATAGAGFALLPSIMAGASAMGAVDSIGMALLPQKLLNSPPLNNLQVDSSAAGSPIPRGYGQYRIAGAVIWATQIQESTHIMHTGSKGGPSSNVYIYTVSLAVSFGYGPGTITRIWADSKLIYDVTGKGPIAIGTGYSHHNGLAITEPFVPTLYDGTQTQPDPTIQAAEGVSLTPSYKNQVYMVLTNFPLSDFADRVPSFRAEITASASLQYTKDLFAGSQLSGVYNMLDLGPRSVLIDPISRKGYAFAYESQVVQAINLDANQGEPADPWQTSTLYNVGDEILDSNGNIQYCFVQHTSDHSAAREPVWNTGENQESKQFGGPPSGPYVWLNIGPGPNIIPQISNNQITWALAGGAGNLSNGLQSNCIDTAGYYWTGAQGSDGFPYFVKFRAITGAGGGGNQSPAWSEIAQIKLPAGFTQGGMTPIKSTSSGTNYVYAITDADGTGFMLYVINSDTNALVASGLLAAPFTLELSSSPIVDPATGLCYLWGTSGATHYIITADPRSGTVIFTEQTLSDTSFLSGDSLYDGLWDPNDGTVFGYSSGGGSLCKVNPATGQVLSSYAGATAGHPVGGADLPSTFCHGYNCIVPSDGVLKLPSDISGTTVAFGYYSTTDCSLQQLVEQSNWLPANGNQSITNFAYDPLSNSALVTQYLGGYNGLFMRIYFDRQKVASTDLGTLLQTEWALSGAPSYFLDTSLVDGVISVQGYPITTTSTLKSIFFPLCQAYFFDLVESDNVLRAIPRGQAVSTIIPESDLGLFKDKYELQPTISQENDIPRRIELMYSDPALNYQQNKQMAQRNKRVKETRNESEISVPLTLQADTASSIVSRMLATAWAERNGWDIKLWRASYLRLDPSDVIQFTYNGNPYQARLNKATMGQDYTLELSGVSEDPRQYVQTGQPTQNLGFIGGSLLPVGPTVLFILDTPYISDADNGGANTGYYYAMSSPTPNWPGGVLYSSLDNSTFLDLVSDTTEETYGTVSVATPAPATLFSWDNVTQIIVYLQGGGSLSGTTLLNVLNGQNWFYLGGEIMAFSTATLNTDGSYTLSGLLRGLRGTEGWCGTHVVGETFMMLAGAQFRNGLPSSYVGVLQYFRGVSIGLPVTAATSQQVTLQGNDLKPYAVAQLMGSFAGGSLPENLTITWVRRTRVSGAWLDGTGTVPLSEQAESYDLYVYDNTGLVLKRSVLGLNTPTYLYTVAQQEADFPATGQSSYYVVVYQNSAVVGHGFPATNPLCGAGVVVSGGSDATSILGVPITGTPADGDILQYNASANQWEMVALPASSVHRTTVVKTTASLTNGQVESGTLDLSGAGCKSFILLSVEVDDAARVELYSTAAFQAADSGRGYNIPPTSGSQNGIICDMGLTTGGDEKWTCSPPLLGANMDSVPAQKVYYAITNLAGTGTRTVTFTIIAVEN